MIAKHQKFRIETIHRSQLLNAPYNPRKIGAKQRTELKKNLKRVGLVGPLIWNEVTGNLVSGHQRIDILDELEKSADYELTVSVVSLDDKTEKEQNVFLNSTTFTGEFDLEKLAVMLNDGDIDYKLAGLDEYDLNVIGVDFDSRPDPPDEDEQAFQEIQADREAERAASIEALKQRKRDSKQEIYDRAGSGETYVTLSFDNFENKTAFMRRFNLNEEDLYIKGEYFVQILNDKAMK